MPETKTPAATALVIGAGELGRAVINGLLEQNARNAASINILLRPPANAAEDQVAHQLQGKRLRIVHGNLAVETLDCFRDKVAYVPEDTSSHAQFADIVERHLGRDLDRLLWETSRLRSEAASRPDEGMRKDYLAFAHDTGVAWNKQQTFRAMQGIQAMEMPAWLDQREATSYDRLIACRPFAAKRCCSRGLRAS